MENAEAASEVQPARQSRDRSVYLGWSPFDVFYIALILTPIVISLLLPVIQWVRTRFQ